MTRRLSPRYILRGRERGPRSAHNTARTLLLEQLDKRIVLSGMPEAVCLDTPAEIASEAQPAVTESSADLAAEAAVATVYLADDGVLHVQPTVEETNIVVRQYVDYQMQELIEVEVAGQWTAFPAEQVQEIQVHQVSADQQLDITDGVTISVELIEVEAVDAAFTESDPPEVETSEAPLGPADPSEPPPEGEPPIGGGEDPAPTPPAISNFVVSGDSGYWEFTGQVSDDDNVDGLVVRFGGLLDGMTATVNQFGIFSITVFLSPGTMGGVTAITTDGDGLDSNQASTII